MSDDSLRGRTYRCPVCGAEVTVLAGHEAEAFCPRCCNVDMVRTEGHVVFYVCPVCGAEIGVLKVGGGTFYPRCCNVDMQRAA